MKKFMLAAAVMIMSLGAKAQDEVGQITIAPTVGLNLASITGDGSESIAAFTVGATAEYGLSEDIGLSAGVMYSMQGAKGGGDKLKLGYINIPILANYYIWEGLAIKAGLQPGIMLSAKFDGVDIKKGCNSFDLAIPVGVSYEFSKIVVDARYNIGVTKIMDGADSKNSVMQFTVGYKF